MERRFITIILAVSLLYIIVTCTGKKPTAPNLELEGVWRGLSEAVYPGPVDEPLYAEDNVIFAFDNGYFVIWDEMEYNQNPIIPPPRSSGSYRQVGDTIYLENISISNYDPTFHLVGAFIMTWDGYRLTLLQEWDTSIAFFPEKHQVTLHVPSGYLESPD